MQPRKDSIRSQSLPAVTRDRRGSKASDATRSSQPPAKAAAEAAPGGCVLSGGALGDVVGNAQAAAQAAEQRQSPAELLQDLLGGLKSGDPKSLGIVGAAVAAVMAVCWLLFGAPAEEEKCGAGGSTVGTAASWASFLFRWVFWVVQCVGFLAAGYAVALHYEDKKRKAQEEEELAIAKLMGKRKALDQALAAEAIPQPLYEDLVWAVDKEQYHDHLAAAMGPGEVPAPWFTDLMREMWPGIQSYVKKDIIDDWMEPMLQGMVGKSLKFKHAELGDAYPRMGPIKSRRVVDRKGVGVEWSIGMDYRSNCNILLQIGPISVGVVDFQLIGTMLVYQRPMQLPMPFIGGMEVTFLNRPHVSLNFTGVGNLCEIPGLHGTVMKVIEDGIAGSMVLPWRIAFPIDWTGEVDKCHLRMPEPAGILRVKVVRAKKLMAADTGLTGKATSDPFVKVTLGTETKQTPTIFKTLNPEWNEDNLFDFQVHSREQWLEFEVFDYDQMSSPDPLGGIKHMSVNELLGGEHAGAADHTLELKGVKGAEELGSTLTFSLQWLDLKESDEDEGAAEVMLGGAAASGAQSGTGSTTNVAAVAIRLEKVTGHREEENYYKIKAEVRRKDPPSPKGRRGSKGPGAWAEQESWWGWGPWDGYPDQVCKDIEKNARAALAKQAKEGVAEKDYDYKAVAAALEEAGCAIDEKAVKDMVAAWEEEKEAEQQFRSAKKENAVSKKKLAELEQVPKTLRTKWEYAVSLKRTALRAAAEPQFEQKLFFLLPPDWESITLTLLDKNGKAEAGLRFPSVRAGGCLGRAAALRAGAAAYETGRYELLDKDGKPVVDRGAGVDKQGNPIAITQEEQVGISVDGPFRLCVPDECLAKGTEEGCQLHGRLKILSLVPRPAAGLVAIVDEGKSHSMYPMFGEEMAPLYLGKFVRQNFTAQTLKCQTQDNLQRCFDQCGVRQEHRHRLAGLIALADEATVPVLEGEQGCGKRSVVVEVQRGLTLIKQDMTSSDPFVTCTYRGEKEVTPVIKKTLNPEWREQNRWEFPLTDAGHTVELLCEDWDLTGSPDFMGWAVFNPVDEAVKALKAEKGEGAQLGRVVRAQLKLPLMVRPHSEEDRKVLRKKGHKGPAPFGHLVVHVAVHGAADAAVAGGVGLLEKDRLVALFKRIDKNGNGSMTRAELILRLRQDPEVREATGLGKSVRQNSDEQKAFEKLYQKMDADASGDVSCEEFVQFLLFNSPGMAPVAAPAGEAARPSPRTGAGQAAVPGTPGDRTPSPEARHSGDSRPSHGRDDELSMSPTQPGGGGELNSPVSGVVVKEGWLNKLGGLFGGTPQARYFVLQGGKLRYWRKLQLRSTEDAAGTMRMRDARSVESDDIKLHITLRFPSKKDPVVLIAASRDDYDKWKEQLRRAAGGTRDTHMSHQSHGQ